MTNFIPPPSPYSACGALSPALSKNIWHFRKILDPVKVEEACEKLDREHISYWLTTKKSTPIEVKNLTDLLQRIVDRSDSIEEALVVAFFLGQKIGLLDSEGLLFTFLMLRKEG